MKSGDLDKKHLKNSLPQIQQHLQKKETRGSNYREILQFRCFRAFQLTESFSMMLNAAPVIAFDNIRILNINKMELGRKRHFK